MRLTQKQISTFRKHIFAWWKTHRRDLPWRHTHDPYKILISEVMLQQTQVSRVLSKYKEFLTLFPDVRTLAAASPANALRAWKGMGYNRRALYLHKAAQIICAKYNSCFPMNYELLAELPGLGKYTARAILVFAYRENIAMVDTNIRQIITHFFFHDGPQKESIIQDVADQLLPKGKSWEWHQALMDYGALALPKRRTQNTELNDQKKKHISFRETNRFYRGRIIDRLREGYTVESDLIQEFIGTYGKSEDFISSILNGLERDGLIIRLKKGTLSLPV